MDTMETNLPKMVRELIEFYIEQRINPRLETFVTHKDHKDSISSKMDYVLFNDYVKTQLQKDAVNDKEFRIEERLFQIEKNIKSQVTKEELKGLLKNRASNERLIELRENVHKLQVMSISNSEKQEKDFKRLDT